MRTNEQAKKKGGKKKKKPAQPKPTDGTPAGTDTADDTNNNNEEAAPPATEEEGMTPTAMDAGNEEADKTKEGEIQQEMQRCRMTLRCREVKPLEDTCKQIIANASADFKTKGPVRIPTKKLSITTRRSPCGNGTNTWDRYEMRIHKRYIDIYCPASAIKTITDFRIDPGVDVHMLMY